MRSLLLTPVTGLGLLALRAVSLVELKPSAASPTGEPAGAQAAREPRHRIVYHISSNDPPTMQRGLGTIDNVLKLYRSRRETARIEIVANGGGVHMMRSDTTPVSPMLQYMRSTYPDLILTVCGHTKTIMEANEVQSVQLLSWVGITTAGIARVVELQEAGYAYVKP